VNVLASLLGRRPSRERPDLAAWLGGVVPVLVVDGDGSGAAFPGARVLRHETSGGPGLPFHFPDPRRLPFADGEFRAVVLAGVIDEVIDAGAAIDEACRVLAKGGLLLVVQTVAPEDFEERAIWNAIAGMREARHTSTPSGRQFAAMVSGLRMEVVREAAWEEDADSSATQRPGVADQLALMLAAAAARGATGVVRDGALVVARRASLLRRS
jgi:SAM-dependent methyltransferase